jgi:DNA-binding Lrp family transcriptional regulator
MMDALDRQIVNTLQGGLPIAPRPYAMVAAHLGIAETDLIARLDRLMTEGLLSRFGPLYDAERLGGAVTLAAMAVPEARFEAIAEIVNAFPEVAHNYARDHRLNMWFVVASDDPARIAEVLDAIARATGLQVINLPKLEEYFLELKLQA